MKWIKNAGISITNSSSWGNYKSSKSPANVTGYGKKQVTGYSEYWKFKNIYDLAGNVWEWTGEKYSSEFILRGGSYYEDSNHTVSYRYKIFPSHYYDNISFRIMLFVM